VRKVSYSPIMTLSQGKGTERILQKESYSLVMTLLNFNAPAIKNKKRKTTRIVVSKTRILVVVLLICC
jgi:hypothetical protein